MYWIFIINPENMKIFVWLLMHVIRLFISILTDFVTSHKIAFYSKLYDIDFLENCTHDRTYITLYVHEFLLRLHQHCFFGQKSPTYYLTKFKFLCAWKYIYAWFNINVVLDVSWWAPFPFLKLCVWTTCSGCNYNYITSNMHQDMNKWMSLWNARS